MQRVEICVLASGSTGNCIYVAGGGTRLLIDAGLSLKETSARLAQLGDGFGWRVGPNNRKPLAADALKASADALRAAVAALPGER